MNHIRLFIILQFAGKMSITPYQLDQLVTIMEQWYSTENRLLLDISGELQAETTRLRHENARLHDQIRRLERREFATMRNYHMIFAQHQQLGNILRMILDDNTAMQRMYRSFVRITSTGGLVFNVEGELTDIEEESMERSDEEMEERFVEEQIDRVRRRLDFDEE